MTRLFRSILSLYGSMDVSSLPICVRRRLAVSGDQKATYRQHNASAAVRYSTLPSNLPRPRGVSHSCRPLPLITVEPRSREARSHPVSEQPRQRVLLHLGTTVARRDAVERPVWRAIAIRQGVIQLPHLEGGVARRLSRQRSRRCERVRERLQRQRILIYLPEQYPPIRCACGKSSLDPSRVCRGCVSSTGGTKGSRRREYCHERWLVNITRQDPPCARVNLIAVPQPMSLQHALHLLVLAVS